MGRGLEELNEFLKGSEDRPAIEKKSEKVSADATDLHDRNLIESLCPLPTPAASMKLAIQAAFMLDGSAGRRDLRGRQYVDGGIFRPRDREKCLVGNGEVGHVLHDGIRLVHDRVMDGRVQSVVHFAMLLGAPHKRRKITRVRA